MDLELDETELDETELSLLPRASLLSRVRHMNAALSRAGRMGLALLEQRDALLHDNDQLRLSVAHCEEESAAHASLATLLRGEVTSLQHALLRKTASNDRAAAQLAAADAENARLHDALANQIDSHHASIAVLRAKLERARAVVSAATKAALITQLSRSNWRHIVIASATKSAQAAKAMAGMLNPVKNRPSAADTVTACAVAN